MSSYVSDLSTRFTDMKMGNTGYAYLLSNQGKVIDHHEKTSTPVLTDFTKHPVLVAMANTSKAKIIFTDDITSKPTIAFAQKTASGWIVVLQQDMDEAYAPINILKKNACIALGFSLFTMVWAFFIIIRYVFPSHWKAPEEKLRTLPRITAAILLLGIIPFCVNWLMSYQSSMDRISKGIDQRLNVQSDILVSYIDIWMEMAMKMLRQNASLQDMQSMEPKKQKPILLSIVKEYPKYWIAFTMMPNGQNIARSDDAPFVNVAEREWFQRPAKGEPYGSDVVIAKTSGRPTWPLAVPILNDDKKIVGVLAVSSHLTDISNGITNINVGKTGFAFVLTEKGRLVAHHKTPFNQALLDFSKHPAVLGLNENGKKKSYFLDTFSKKNAIALAQKAKYGWTVVLQQDVEEGYETIKEANHRNLILLFCSLILLSVLSFVFCKNTK